MPGRKSPLLGTEECRFGDQPRTVFGLDEAGRGRTALACHGLAGCALACGWGGRDLFAWHRSLLEWFRVRVLPCKVCSRNVSSRQDGHGEDLNASPGAWHVRREVR